MNRILKIIIFWVASSTSYAQENSTPYTIEIQEVVTNFLKRETTGFPGRVEISVPPPIFNQTMAACAKMSASMDERGRRYGSVSVKVSCQTEKNYSIFVQAKVKIIAPYYVFTRHMSAHSIIQSDDVQTVEGDVSGFFDVGVFDANFVVGKELKFSVAQGLPVRKGQIRNPPIVKSGQKVRVVYSDPGFSVSVVGVAMFDGGIGDVVQVRTDNGKVISGVVSGDGSISIR